MENGGVKRKSWGQIQKHNTSRMSIQQALTIIGMPIERIYILNTDYPRGWRIKNTSEGVHTRFWEMDEYELQDIAQDMKRIFRSRLSEIGHDFTENHEGAQRIIGAYSHAKRLFRAHGIEI